MGMNSAATADQIIGSRRAPIAFGLPGQTTMSSETVKLSANDVLMEQILNSKAFRRMDKGALRTMVQKIELLQVQAGETLFRQGEVGDCFYIIRDGHCRVLVTGLDGEKRETAVLGPGDTFGEDSLIIGTPRGATMEMQTEGTLARLNKADFETLIKNPMLQGVSVEEAKLMLADNVCVLDVRKAEEFKRFALPGSRSVPLQDLRRERRGFDRAFIYIAVSDRELEAALAAFLLAQKGLDARYLNGTVTELIRSCASSDIDSLALPGDGSRENVIELPEEYLRGSRDTAAAPRVTVNDRPDLAATTPSTVARMPQPAKKPEAEAGSGPRGDLRRMLADIESRHRQELGDLRSRMRKVLQQHQDRIAALESRLELLEKHKIP
jgi:CRP-like cAMP-binding protein